MSTLPHRRLAWATLTFAVAGLAASFAEEANVVRAALAACLVLAIASLALRGPKRTTHSDEQVSAAPARPAKAEELPYEMLDEIGHGSMGTVMRAKHRMLGRVVALKRIRSDSLDDEEMARFEREARATSALVSPHTIKLFEFGKYSGGYYYAMEYLDGLDLQRLVRDHGPISPARATSIVAQACHSLAEAHERGIVHRDVKPANLMLCRYGLDVDFVKLLDFGLAKRMSANASSRLTGDGTVLGTAAYLAPESLKGSAHLDCRADIYALGAVLFWLVSGKLLFDHTRPLEMARAHLMETPPRLSEKSPVPVPAELDEVVAACLEKERDRRPQTATELRRRLLAIPQQAPWTAEDSERWWKSHV